MFLVKFCSIFVGGGAWGPPSQCTLATAHRKPLVSLIWVDRPLNTHQFSYDWDGSKPWHLVNIKIAGKWMFIPLKMVLIGIDPYPYNHITYTPRLSPQFTDSVLNPFLGGGT